MPAIRKDYSKAVSLYEKGNSINDVASVFNITRQAMHSILRRRGVQFRNNLRFGKENHFYRGGVFAEDKAHNMVEQAINRGELINPKVCESCESSGEMRDGRTIIQAHHDDYNKPLSVRWLCQKCHHEWHKNNKAIPLEEK